MKCQWYCDLELAHDAGRPVIKQEDAATPAAGVSESPRVPGGEGKVGELAGAVIHRDSDSHS